MGNLRFSVYKFLLALSNLLGFRFQKVWPLELPSDEKIKTVPFSSIKPRTEIDGLYDVENFPRTEHAARRLRQIYFYQKVMGLFTKIAPKDTPEIPSTASELVRTLYHPLFKVAWAKAPQEPRALAENDDCIASLAVSGPFADYLRKMRQDDMESINKLAEVSIDDYCIDLAFMERYPVKTGLRRVGGLAILGVNGDQLFTRGIYSSSSGTLVRPGDEMWLQCRSTFLAGLNEHLTTIRHNIYTHLAYVTPMVVASCNCLSSRHPVRRLLHPCFQTALIGNREVGQFQIRGKKAFSARIFSHDHGQVVAMINDCLAAFSLAMMDPEEDAQRRGVLTTPFPYPHRDMVMEYWKLTLNAVTEYLMVYYENDESLLADNEVVQWFALLHELTPGADDEFNATLEDSALTVVARVCAAYIHTSTVTHDVINNMVWNYCTMNHLIPTVVPVGPERQPQLNAFELVLTLIGTWKPFNMLLEGGPFRATDERAQAVLDRYLGDLRAMCERLRGSSPRPEQVYPDELNYSVSN